VNSATGRRAAYPGTFDPPTIAHLAIAEAARAQCGVDRVDFVLNDQPLGKGAITPLARRLAMLEAVAASRPWLGVAVSEYLHLADIARGYEVLVMGADKWEQLLDVQFYADAHAREDALSRLPQLAVAPRHGHRVPDDCVLLEIDLAHVSSTRARAGQHDLVPPEARPFLS
jgi:nicotinic acid mononucleotide adenylyltransferase